MIDSHTMGEPTRIVYDGFPKLVGNTMIERKEYLEKNYDHYRRALMLEPRGHRDMFGALLTEPINAEADFGVIFMDSGGYLNMCGHGSIGCAMAIVETGMVKVTEPYTTVVLDAPAGIIRANVKVKNGRVQEVSILNVPSFLYKENLKLKLGKYGVVPFDISFGGSFFALVDSEKVGLEISQENIENLTDFGMRLREKINRTIEIKHPYLDITTVDLVEIYGKSDSEKADRKNVVIFGDAQADRSPCGTGTSAKVAALYSKGELALGQKFVYESITGSMFTGVATKEIKIGSYKAVIPQITGSAYLTGYNQWVLDEQDPLCYGFLMGQNKSKHQPDIKTRIIEIAWDLFKRKGYEQTDISEIIEASGISRDVFEEYFTSKEDLLHTLSDVFDQRYAELMVSMNPKQSAFEKLLIINRELFTMIEDKIPMDLLAYLYSEQILDTEGNHLLNQDRIYYQFVEQIVKEGLSSGEFLSKESPEKLVNDYAMLERALLYDWCIHKNKISLVENSNRLMPIFLKDLVMVKQSPLTPSV